MANIKLNYTAFTSASMAQKVTDAMYKCLETGEVVRVANRRGKEELFVTIAKDSLGYTFRFFSMYDHAEVGDLILKAHHGWDEPHSVAFWSMLSATYELTEHPLITERKRSEESLKSWNMAQEEIRVACKSDVGAAPIAANLVHALDSMRQQRTVDQLHKNLGATHKATDSLGRVVYLSYKRSWFGLGKTKTKLYETRFDALNGSWSSHILDVNGSAFTIQGVL